MERYLQVDVGYLMRGSFWMLLAQGFGFALSFVLMLFFTNWVSRETYGEYRFLTAALSFLGIIALPSLGHAYMRAVAKGRSGILFEVIKKKLSYGYIASLVAFAAALYYLIQGNTHLFILFTIIAGVIPFFDLHAIYGIHLSGNRDFKTLSLFSTIQRTAVVIGLILSIVLSGNIFVIFSTFLGITIITNYIFFKKTLAKYPPSKETDTETIPYGIHLSIVGALQQAASYLDKLVLWKVAGPATVAMQAISIALPQEIGNALNQVNGIALPKMATRATEELRRAIPRKFCIFFLLTLPIAGLYILTAPYLFKFFFPQYLDTLPFVLVASFLIFTAPVTFLSQYFYATKHTRAIYWIQSTESLVSIALFVILIPLYGVYGAILALDIKICTTFLLSAYFIFTDTRKEIT
jgi:O-antigen/teichoic acid export membrane protein